MLHKPALLGILGAIIGLEGFQQAPIKRKKKKEKNSSLEESSPRKVAPYYTALKELKIGIQPLRHENGNFSKTTIRYNNGVGYANLDGGNLLVAEQTLIAPAYRCYVLFERKDEIFQHLFQNLQQNNAEYLPYLGKNEFSVYWKNWQEYSFWKMGKIEEAFRINSIFIKEAPIKDGIDEDSEELYRPFMIFEFAYFENLPVDYNEELMQYRYRPFAYSDYLFKQEYSIFDLYYLEDTNEIIQLF